MKESLLKDVMRTEVAMTEEFMMSVRTQISILQTRLSVIEMEMAVICMQLIQVGAAAMTLLNLCLLICAALAVEVLGTKMKMMEKTTAKMMAKTTEKETTKVVMKAVMRVRMTLSTVTVYAMQMTSLAGLDVSSASTASLEMANVKIKCHLNQ